ncbi:MAG: hypothetical protein OEM04_00225 [Flavobacteriaceae bacterium]|nr:hypothetical protein [Flavobacteriaceae bacterium]
MGILNLKSKTAHKYIKKQPKNTTNLELSSVNKIQTVVVIAEVDLFKTYDFTKKLSENLRIDKNNIKVILLTNDSNEKAFEFYEVFSEKSFGLNGKLNNESLKNMVDAPSDLLINYCSEATVYGQVLTCRSKAKLKVGFENEYAYLYNLTIQLPGNKIDTFNNEIVKYLEILNLLK